ncbi:formate/nitrite transporter family protein [Jannaschia rubra]|uniref:Inner membrane protein YfdC n=1 Tax=Jannaschia rubra TaxID=282197 RepID=A0A0M6XN69_9RHOB|nr:formate/nitrite transporter family protein [Jannaschia rubra]CTQ31575.1 Inner membrane protein YfdC [Jannaschia rubra]SFF76987.1 Formate/nitrite transporter FocA, FNT family [Jannaschia rubra]
MNDGRNDADDPSDAETAKAEQEAARAAKREEAETRAKVRERETREKTPTRTEKSLTREERNAVSEHGKLSALTVYSIILREGEEELSRPKTSLWWSGVAAGIGISTSVLVEGVIRANLGSDHIYINLIESLGYTFGFVLVIMCRLQLFTENTITVVLPLLAEPTRKRFLHIARLWAIVFAANMIGTFVTAALAVHGGILADEVLIAVLEISRHVAHFSPFKSLLLGIPSGFFIAALVWMLPSSKGSEVLIIIMFTWLIAAGGFTHVVAGSNEIFTLVFNGELGIVGAFGYHILPVLIGNVLGGTGLFAMLAYGQIHDEM